MKFKYHKYRKEFAIVILLSYLFLVALSIFHYHHVDILAGNYMLESSAPETGASPFDKLIDTTHECTIQQFAHTVLDYNHIKVFDFVQNTCEQELPIKEINQHPLDSNYDNNPHRGPPLI
jgi:hypothetical protein